MKLFPHNEKCFHLLTVYVDQETLIFSHFLFGGFQKFLSSLMHRLSHTVSAFSGTFTRTEILLYCHLYPQMHLHLLLKGLSRRRKVAAKRISFPYIAHGTSSSSDNPHEEELHIK